MNSLSSNCLFFNEDLDRLKNHFFFGKGGGALPFSIPDELVFSEGDDCGVVSPRCSSDVEFGAVVGEDTAFSE